LTTHSFPCYLFSNFCLPKHPDSTFQKTNIKIASTNCTAKSQELLWIVSILAIWFEFDWHPMFWTSGWMWLQVRVIYKVGEWLWIYSLTNCSIQFKCTPLSFNNTITLINGCSLEIWQNVHHRQPHQIRPSPRYTPISRPLLGSSFQSFPGPTSDIISHLCLFQHNRVFIKLRKTQHQNPEFGPKPGEIPKKPAKQVH